jgi:hypothetical protein
MVHCGRGVRPLKTENLRENGGGGGGVENTKLEENNKTYVQT